jgi:hypothetical protein
MANFRKGRLGLALMTAGLLIPAAARAADAPVAPPSLAMALPPLATIIAQAVARDEATQQLLRGMQYQQATQTEQLDAGGRVTKRQELVMEVRSGAANELQVVSAKGDNLPTDPDQAAQKAKGQEMARRKHDFSLRTLVSRFTITSAGMGEFMGRPAYIVAFEPKPNQPYRDQTEKVLNQLHGRMWIDARDDVVLKTEATLARPVSVAWIFAKISRLDFQYELRSGSSDFGPAWLQVAVEVDAPLISFRQRQTVEMTRFEARGKSAGAKRT